MQELWIGRGCYYQRLVACRWQTGNRKKKRKPRSTHRSDGRSVSSTHIIRLPQYNVIVDVLWGVSRKTLDSIKDFVGVRARSYWICKKQSSQVPLTLHRVSKFSLRRTYELAKLLPVIFWGFLILFHAASAIESPCILNVSTTEKYNFLHGAHICRLTFSLLTYLLMTSCR